MHAVGYPEVYNRYVCLARRFVLDIQSRRCISTTGRLYYCCGHFSVLAEKLERHDCFTSLPSGYLLLLLLLTTQCVFGIPSNSSPRRRRGKEPVLGDRQAQAQRKAHPSRDAVRCRDAYSSCVQQSPGRHLLPVRRTWLAKPDLGRPVQRRRRPLAATGRRLHAAGGPPRRQPQQQRRRRWCAQR